MGINLVSRSRKKIINNVLHFSDVQNWGVQYAFFDGRKRFYMKPIFGEEMKGIAVKKFTKKIKPSVKQLDSKYRISDFVGQTISLTLTDYLRLIMQELCDYRKSIPIGIDKGARKLARLGFVYSIVDDAVISVENKQKDALNKQFRAFTLHSAMLFFMYRYYFERLAKEHNVNVNVVVSAEELRKMKQVETFVSRIKFVQGAAGSGKTYNTTKEYKSEETLIVAPTTKEVGKYKGQKFASYTVAGINECFFNLTTKWEQRVERASKLKERKTIIIDEYMRVTPEFMAILMVCVSKSAEIIMVGDCCQYGDVKSNLKPFTNIMNEQCIREYTEIKRQKKGRKAIFVVKYLYNEIRNFEGFTPKVEPRHIKVVESGVLKGKDIKPTVVVALKKENLQRLMQIEAGYASSVKLESTIVSVKLAELAKEAGLQVEPSGFKDKKVVKYYATRTGKVVIPSKKSKSESMKSLREFFLSIKRIEAIEAKREYYTVHASQGMTVKGVVIVCRDVFESTLDGVYVATSRSEIGYVLQD